MQSLYLNSLFYCIDNKIFKYFFHTTFYIRLIFLSFFFSLKMYAISFKINEYLFLWRKLNIFLNNTAIQQD